MIKTHAQAVAIQDRRVKAGKRGYAKAVRRYLQAKRAGTYLDARNQLPVRWDRVRSSQQGAALLASKEG